MFDVDLPHPAKPPASGGPTKGRSSAPAGGVPGLITGSLSQPAPSVRTAADPPDPQVPTIFHQPWWLDIVTDKTWEQIDSLQDGRVVGRMVYLRKPRLWFETSRMPMLTHFLGPGIDVGEGSANARMLRRSAITRDLISQLPRIAAFSQKMHRDVNEVIAFQMEGFETTVQFTYELKPAPIEELWKRMRDKTRNAARKAAQSYVVDDTMGPQGFADLYRANIAAMGRDGFIDMDVVKQLIAACQARGCGQILSARDQQGAVKAAIFCVWDHAVCYYLLSTRSPDSGNGAVTLLLWSAIQRAAVAGLVFDFDGLGYAGAVLFYTGFGAEVRPRYIVSRSDLQFRVLREIRRLLGEPDNPFT
jgi:hypothetical protein